MITWSRLGKCGETSKQYYGNHISVRLDVCRMALSCSRITPWCKHTDYFNEQLPSVCPGFYIILLYPPSDHVWSEVHEQYTFCISEQRCYQFLHSLLSGDDGCFQVMDFITHVLLSYSKSWKVISMHWNFNYFETQQYDTFRYLNFLLTIS